MSEELIDDEETRALYTDAVETHGVVTLSIDPATQARRAEIFGVCGRGVCFAEALHDLHEQTHPSAEIPDEPVPADPAPPDAIAMARVRMRPVA